MYGEWLVYCETDWQGGTNWLVGDYRNKYYANKVCKKLNEESGENNCHVVNIYDAKELKIKNISSYVYRER